MEKMLFISIVRQKLLPILRETVSSHTFKKLLTEVALSKKEDMGMSAALVSAGEKWLKFAVEQLENTIDQEESEDSHE